MARTMKRRIYSGAICEQLVYQLPDGVKNISEYDPEKLKYGYNTVDGEEIYFIPNPALGLWIDRERFNA